MTIGKIVTFHCNYEYKNDNVHSINKIITGRCENTKIYNEYLSVDYWNILIKINNKWYELTDPKINNNQQLTIYNYEKGPLSEKIEFEKNSEKFNV